MQRHHHLFSPVDEICTTDKSGSKCHFMGESVLTAGNCAADGSSYTLLLNQRKGVDEFWSSRSPDAVHTAGRRSVSLAVLASHWSSGAEEPG